MVNLLIKVIIILQEEFMKEEIYTIPVMDGFKEDCECLFAPCGAHWKIKQ